MPVEDHPVHPKVKHGPDARYGCWNKPRPVAGAPVVGSPAYGSQAWPFQNSTECKHDKRESDDWCAGCEWINDGVEPRP